MSHAFRPIFAICLALSLAACGSDGGGAANSVVSTPPPPPSSTIASTDVTRTPLSSADHFGLTGGDFPALAVTTETDKSPDGQEIGAQRATVLGSGGLRLSYVPAAKTYTLEFNVSGFPANKVFDLGTLDPDFGNHIVKTDHYTDGKTVVSQYDATATHAFVVGDPSNGVVEIQHFDFSADLHYVSLGIWSLEYGTGSTPGSFTSSIFNKAISAGFVTGRRTEPGELPVSGSASYRIQFQDVTLQTRTISDFRKGYFVDGAEGQLVADFSARTIAASIDLSLGEDSGPQFSVSGSDAITSAGNFQIAVSGSRPTADLQSTEPVGGTLQGAFFGPNAEETGGVIQLQQGGAPIYAGAFVGSKN